MARTRVLARTVMLGVTVAALLGSGGAGAGPTAPATVASAVTPTRGTGAAPAMDAFSPVVREVASGLPDRTVYRPADLDEVGHRVPALIWSNGG